jgi:hypothetical protein
MTDITISLTEQEQAWFRALLDTALRHSGIGALEVAAHFKGKLDSAQPASQLVTPQVEQE